MRFVGHYPPLIKCYSGRGLIYFGRAATRTWRLRGRLRLVALITLHLLGGGKGYHSLRFEISGSWLSSPSK